MSVEKRAALVRDECERLAKEAESTALDPLLAQADRLEAMERAKLYWQMSRAEADTVANALRARVAPLTGRNRGPQRQTVERTAFLRMVAARIGTEKREAIALEAVSAHAGRVRSLWRAEGDSARRKMLKFMDNHGL